MLLYNACVVSYHTGGAPFPRPPGPGERVTGARGFTAANETSFCIFTPFPLVAVPAFSVTFGDLPGGG